MTEDDLVAETESEFRREQIRQEAVAEARAIREESVAAGVNPKGVMGRKKVRLSLLPTAGLIPTAVVMGLGADKYGPMNWRDTPIEITDYEDAIWRHLLAIIDGEDVDPESGQSHMAHIAATSLIVLDAEATGNLIDNRPTVGASGQLIRDLKK